MDIQEAVQRMESYLLGIMEYPDPYRDPDYEVVETLIDFVKKHI